MEYLKFETHCHTEEVSACGRVPAADMVKLYKAAGVNPDGTPAQDPAAGGTADNGYYDANYEVKDDDNK